MHVYAEVENVCRHQLSIIPALCLCQYSPFLSCTLLSLLVFFLRETFWISARNWHCELLLAWSRSLFLLSRKWRDLFVLQLCPWNFHSRLIRTRKLLRPLISSESAMELITSRLFANVIELVPVSITVVCEWYYGITWWRYIPNFSW